MKQRIIVLGGGGHAKVVIDCLLAQGFDVVGVIDKNKTGALLGIPISPEYNANLENAASILVAIGDNVVRQKLVDKISHRFANAVHPSALLSPFATFGEGCMILHRAIVQAGSRIGNHVILNTGSQVDHDGTIADYVHVAPGAILCGNVSVGEGTLIGAGAVVMPGVKIGKWSIVGAGAVVSDDVGDHSVVAGVPAMLMRKNNQ